jgi:hypothetical protein
MLTTHDVFFGLTLAGQGNILAEGFRPRILNAGFSGYQARKRIAVPRTRMCGFFPLGWVISRETGKIVVRFQF